ncbi:hypothetical protein Hanom_Chr14g01250831 [Helianthus anomalus]
MSKKVNRSIKKSTHIKKKVDKYLMPRMAYHLHTQIQLPPSPDQLAMEADICKTIITICMITETI